MNEQQKQLLDRTEKMIERLRDFRQLCVYARLFQLAAVLKAQIAELERTVVSQRLELEFVPSQLPNWAQDEEQMVLWEAVLNTQLSLLKK